MRGDSEPRLLNGLKIYMQMGLILDFTIEFLKSLNHSSYSSVSGLTWVRMMLSSLCCSGLTKQQPESSWQFWLNDIYWGIPCLPSSWILFVVSSPWKWVWKRCPGFLLTWNQEKSSPVSKTHCEIWYMCKKKLRNLEGRFDWTQNAHSVTWASLFLLWFIHGISYLAEFTH